MKAREVAREQAQEQTQRERDERIARTTGLRIPRPPGRGDMASHRRCGQGEGRRWR